jgi:hypothetical protein
MRAELAGAARAVLADLAPPRPRAEVETDRLIALSTFVVRARSAVERDGYSREIELVPPPEAPTRLVVVLGRLLDGLDAIRCDRDDALAIVTKAALDSVPALRLAALATLEAGDDLDTNAVAEAVHYPATATRRALEDLTAHRLVECERQGDGRAHRWKLSTFSRQRMATFPEMLLNTRSERKERDAPSLTFRESPPIQEGSETLPNAPEGACAHDAPLSRAHARARTTSQGAVSAQLQPGTDEALRPELVDVGTVEQSALELGEKSSGVVEPEPAANGRRESLGADELRAALEAAGSRRAE